MVYAFLTPYRVNDGLETCGGTKSSVITEAQPIEDRERAPSARQRPGKFPFAPAESALNAPSHPIGNGVGRPCACDR
jgi:hypothetical protein